MVDQTKLDEWKAVAEAATPGPWATPPTNPSVYRWGQGSSDNVGSVHIAECGNMKDKALRPFNADRWRADASFIAAAREAIPALIGEVERLMDRSDKFMWQVRDTCVRAEKAEAEIERLTRERDEARGNAEIFRSSQYALEERIITVAQERAAAHARGIAEGLERAAQLIADDSEYLLVNAVKRIRAEAERQKGVSARP